MHASEEDEDDGGHTACLFSDEDGESDDDFDEAEDTTEDEESVEATGAGKEEGVAGSRSKTSLEIWRTVVAVVAMTRAVPHMTRTTLLFLWRCLIAILVILPAAPNNS